METLGRAKTPSRAVGPTSRRLKVRQGVEGRHLAHDLLVFCCEQRAAGRGFFVRCPKGYVHKGRLATEQKSVLRVALHKGSTKRRLFEQPA